MKILLVAHQFLPRHITGTEQYVRALARGLRARGVDARIFANEPLVQHDSPRELAIERDEEVDGIPVRRVGLHHTLFHNPQLADYRNPLVGQLLARYLDEVGFDLVHVFHLRCVGTGGIEEPVLRRIPTVVHLMDFWFICPNYLLWRRDGSLCDGPPQGGAGCIDCLDPVLAEALEERGIRAMVEQLGPLPTPGGEPRPSPARQAHALLGREERLMATLARADRVIAPSRFIASVFADHGLPARKILQLPYGLDPERFRDMPRRKESPGRPHLDVGYIGSIARHKGVHVLLEALRHVDVDHLRVHLHGSRDSQPGYSEALVDSIEDPRVTFHGPFPPGELGSVLAGLDLLVVPSLWYENTPFSVLEALHARVPVAASDLGGIAEIVHPGENGLLFPAGDAEALGALLTAAATDPATLELPGSRPPHIDENTESLLKLYSELTGAGW